MPVDPAIAGIVGVIVGAVTSIVTSKMATSANVRIERERRDAERVGRIVELVAEAYVAAANAIQGLHPNTVEDSVDPQFEPELGPVVARAVESLREAQSMMTKAAALGGTPELAQLTMNTAVALDTLDYAWHECQSYRKRLLKSATPREFYEKQLLKNYDLLTGIRRELCGFGDELRHNQVEAGFIAPESLLGRVREATLRTG